MVQSQRMTTTDKDEILAAMAAGFNQIELRFTKIDEQLAHSRQRIDKLEERQLYLELKIDKRFDLLEGMMMTNRREDRDTIQALDVRVTKLEQAATA